MITKKLSAGDIVEARCTRCRAVMNHRIIAMVENRIVRVECNTCNGAHNYHQPATAKTTTAKSTAPKPAAAPRSTKKDPASADRDAWQKLQATLDPDKAIAYDMSRKFRVNEVVAHPVFGLGLVALLISPHKMEVLFAEGKKLLRCL
jgi:hypothetical protein